ncbi:MAG: RDD family protein [Acidobacteria bacterium]|nr:RDD family protein [Acidobacteriota bacterium]
MDKRVGFGLRLGAALLDMCLIVVVSLLLGGTLGALLGVGAGAIVGAGAGSNEQAAAAVTGAAIGAMGGMAIGIAVFGFLYSLVEALTGASPGKMALKLKIAFEDGRQAPVSTYVTRWAVKYAGTLLSVVALIPGLHLVSPLASLASFVIFVGCFLVLGDKRQALHDLAAKTAVFKKADITA